MKTYAIGDCHGAYKALKQVLERGNFDYDNDQLIVLGDVADGWPETPEVIEELLKIKNMVPVMGNHDNWALDFLEYGAQPYDWTLQGGQATLDAYLFRFPELMNKPVGLLLRSEEYEKFANGAPTGEFAWRMGLFASFQAGTELMATEILNRKTVPEQLGKAMVFLVDRPLKKVKSAPAKSAPTQSASSNFDDDLIPF